MGSFRYIDIPKTASMALREAFGRNEKRTLHWPAAAFPHTELLMAVVREPLERLVSCYSQMFDIKKMVDVGFFREWVANDCLWNHCKLQDTPRTVKGMTNLEGVWFALPQVAWLDRRVDVLRFDQLPQNVYEWCFRNGIEIGEIKHINSSNHLPFSQYYDSETESKCRELYAEDFELWRRVTNG